MLKNSYSDIKTFICMNYNRDKDKIKEMGIEDYNDYMVDSVLGNESFEDETDEFMNILAICVVMKEMKLHDDYFFNILDELIIKYKNNEYKISENDKKLINNDLKLI